MKITAHQTTTLLKLLQETFPESSTTKLKKMIQMGCISYKNAAVKHPEFIIQEKESIDYSKYEPKKSYREKAPFPVLFEDDYYLAVFKTMNMPMEGKSLNGRQSLMNAVNSYVSKKRRRPIGLLPVNYLKSNEAGICLFAKTSEAQKSLKEKADSLERTYAAIIEGNLENEKGTFEYWLLKLKDKSVRTVEKNTPNAIRTTSSYKVLKVYDDFSYIEIKTNSSFEDIARMHLGLSGHPVVGDRKYGGNPELIAPLKLYNFKMSFSHPVTHQKIKIETVIPKSFLEELE